MSRNNKISTHSGSDALTTSKIEKLMQDIYFIIYIYYLHLIEINSFPCRINNFMEIVLVFISTFKA